MSFMEWIPRYEIGVLAMDEQHKGLVANMGNLYDRVQANAPISEVLRLVDQLAGLVQAHFAEEEAFMESIEFAEYEKHKLIHGNLIDRLVKHRAQIEANGAVDDEFFAFLKNWLVSHICGIDTKYAAVAAAV